jgi:hypothetical protein
VLPARFQASEHESASCRCGWTDTRSVGRDARAGIAVGTAGQRAVVFAIIRYDPKIAEALVDHLVTPAKNIDYALAVFGDLGICHSAHFPERIGVESRFGRKTDRGRKHKQAENSHYYF